MSKYNSDYEAKEMILEIGRRMYSKNYVAANDGNISCRTDENTIWATPTGVSKGFMSEKTLIEMQLDGTVISKGPLGVSSEIKMHLRIYNENPDAMGVTHAHPPACTSFAIAGLALDQAIYPEALVNLGTVPWIHYETPGSQELAESIAPYCKSHNALLLANHGALSWGESLLDAFYRLESMEHYAMILLYTGSLLGKANMLSYDQVQSLLDIRDRMGIKGGGVPVCVERPMNLNDAVTSYGTIEEARRHTGVSNQTMNPFSTRLTEEDVDRIATAVLDKIEKRKALE
jgi:L-fuculose-phosphate aldolase